MGQKKRKSVVITKDEIKAFKAYLKRFHTKWEAAESVGMTYQSIDRVLWAGSGSPESVEKIRAVISQVSPSEEKVA